MPPELQSSMGGAAAAAASSQEVATHSSLRDLFFARRSKSENTNSVLNSALVKSVIQEAKRVVLHPSRPRKQIVVGLGEEPFGEIALDESLEENPLNDNLTDLKVERTIERPFACAMMLDGSSSMAGEKHLLSSVAVAVLLLKSHSELTSVVTFATRSQVLKRMGRPEKIENTLFRFLRNEPQGFTNIAAGLSEGVSEIKKYRGAGRRVGIIATDGRPTEGRDPLQVARQFDGLHVLHLHGAGSDLSFSRELAAAGRGVCLEVKEAKELPRRLYDAIRLISRR